MRVLLLLACLCWSLPVQAQTPNPYPFTGGDPVIADWLLLAFAVFVGYVIGWRRRGKAGR